MFWDGFEIFRLIIFENLTCANVDFLFVCCLFRCKQCVKETVVCQTYLYKNLNKMASKLVLYSTVRVAYTQPCQLFLYLSKFDICLWVVPIFDPFFGSHLHFTLLVVKAWHRLSTALCCDPLVVHATATLTKCQTEHNNVKYWVCIYDQAKRPAKKRIVKKTKSRVDVKFPGHNRGKWRGVEKDYWTTKMFMDSILKCLAGTFCIKTVAIPWWLVLKHPKQVPRETV